MTTQEYLKQLNWRYATKQFDSSKKLTAEQVQFVKDVLRLSPSSIGVQPWKFVIVDDAATREKLKEKAWGQSQITDASMLVVFTVKKELNTEHVDKVINTTAEIRHQKPEDLAGYRQMIDGLLTTKTPEQLREWSSDQAYIALGMLLSACAQVEIDACPMEGFDRAGFDEVLELDKEGVTSYAVCAVGFRSSEDKYAMAPKARLSEAELFIQR